MTIITILICNSFANLLIVSWLAQHCRPPCRPTHDPTLWIITVGLDHANDVPFRVKPNALPPIGPAHL